MPLTDADLDSLAREHAERLGIVGAQVAVLAGGQITEGVTGSANAVTRVPVTPDTLFQIGSTTKIHTAALVMQLVDEGRIGLDVPVAEQLPGFRLSDDAATRCATPRHLMSMSSGIDNGPYVDLGPGDDAVARYVELVSDLPQVFRPGSGFGYSNASTNVSGRLVEHVTGLTWDEALRTRVLEPAGLADSTTDIAEIVTRRVALGHRAAASAGDMPEIIRPWSLTRAQGPAGATLCSTAGDLVRFAALFLNDGRTPDGTQVLGADGVKAMQDRQVDVPPTLLADWWGLGPYGKIWDGERIVGHSGTNLSGSSYLLWAPDRGLAVATLVNVPEFGYPFAKAVFESVFGAHGITVPPSPTPPAPAEVTVDAARLVGRFEMSGVSAVVAKAAEGLTLSLENERGTTEPSPLVPLTPTTFLPTDPVIDGRRGWAVAFVGRDDQPATHLVNGFFALRRTAA